MIKNTEHWNKKHFELWGAIIIDSFPFIDFKALAYQVFNKLMAYKMYAYILIVQ